MNCHEFKDLLDSLGDSDLPSETRKEAESHLRQCSACRQELEKNDLMIDSIRSFFRDFDPGSGGPLLGNVSFHGSGGPFTFRFPENLAVPPEASGSRTLGPLSSPGCTSKEEALSWVERFFPTFGRPLAWAAVALLLLGISLPFLPSSFNPFSTPVPAAGSWVLVEGSLGGPKPGSGPLPGTGLLHGVKLQALDFASIDLGGRGNAIIQPDSSFEILPDGMKFEGAGKFTFEHSGKGFRIVTPTTRLLITGTEFSLVSHPGFSFVWLREGLIELSVASGVTQLEPGFSCLVKPGGAAKIYPPASGSLGLSPLSLESLFMVAPASSSVPPRPVAPPPALKATGTGPLPSSLGESRGSLVPELPPGPPASSIDADRITPVSPKPVENPEQAFED